jgi:hypothetical protein
VKLSLGIILVAASLLVGGAAAFGSSRCANRIIVESLSPDGKYKAVVFIRGCGSPARFSTQISLVKSKKPLPNVAGNVFIGGVHTSNDEMETNIAATWESPTRLVVSYPEDTEVLKAHTAYKRVEVVFNAHP